MSEGSEHGDNPERAVPPHHLRREDFGTTANSIEQDFERLIHTLRRALEFAEASDVELIGQLSSMKAVAERGAELSKMLVKLAQGEG
jgi:hypothetical protein